MKIIQMLPYSRGFSHQNQFFREKFLCAYIFALVLHVVDIYFLAQTFVISVHSRRQFSWKWEHGFFRKFRKLKVFFQTPCMSCLITFPSTSFRSFNCVYVRLYRSFNTFLCLVLEKRSFCLLPRYYNNWFLSYDLRLETLAENYTYITLEIPQEKLSPYKEILSIF